MAIVFKNNASTTLSAALSSSATSITVADATKLPSITGDEYFFCTIDDGSNIEIVKVTGVSSNTLTIVRAQDNTTAQTFSSGDIIEQRLTAAVLETFPQLDANEITATEFIGDLRGAVIFNAQAGEAIDKGEVVYVSGISGNTPIVALADADDSSKMPAFGLALESASLNNSLAIVTFGTISGVDTDTPGFSLGDTLYVSTTPGALTNSPPAGESSLLQNIGKVQRVHASSGSIKVGGAGRTNAVPNLNDGNIFIGNASNQATTSTLDTSIVPENTNLYYTDARAQAVSINNVVEDTTPQLGGNLDTNGNNILFADSNKAIFGAGSDLQIYHNGTNSFIDEVGTGILYIRAATDLRLTNANSSKLYANFEDGGASKLYYNNGLKLLTTSTGVDITGGLTTSSTININNSSGYGNLELGGASGGFIDFKTPFSDDHDARIIYPGGYLQISTANDEPILLKHNNVDKLVTSSAGIAITGRTLVSDDQTNDWIKQEVSGTTSTISLGNTESTGGTAQWSYNRSTGGLSGNIGAAAGTNFMTVQGTGKIGFGTGSPDGKVHIFSSSAGTVSAANDADDLVLESSTNVGMTLLTGNSSQARIRFGDADSNARGNIFYNHNSDSFGFQTAGSTKLTLTQDGELGLGITNPSDLIDVRGDGADTYIRVGSDTGTGSKTARIGKIDSSTDFIIQASVGTTASNTIFKRNTTAETVRIDSSGNVGIKNTSPAALLHIGDSTNSLGTTAGDQLSQLTLQSDTANGDYLLFTTERLADGSDWTSAAHRIQRKVDATKMGYMQFGSNSADLITFGENASEYVRIDGAGQLGVGTDAPLAKFHTKKDGTGQIIALFSSDLGTYDRNMGILSPASDSASAPFEFSTANSFQFTIDGGAALNIDANKNIGIGTANPNREIDLTADNPRFQFTDSGLSNCKAEISGNSGHLSLQADVGNSQAGSRITFDVDGAEVGRFTDSGLGISATSLNANLHIGSANATGNATNPAIQIGGTTTYRLGLYTTAERGVIECLNGDDGLDFRVKTAGLAMRVYGGTGGVSVRGASALGTGTVTANNVDIGLTGTNITGIKFDTASTAVSGDNRVYLLENKAGDRLAVSTAAGTEILSMLHEGRVGIGVAAPTATLDVDGTIKLDGNYPVGTRNVALGSGALDDASLSGSNNIAIGSSALTVNTTGGSNTGVGNYALLANVDGSSNTAIGYNVLVSNVSGSRNTAIGREALNDNTASDNTAVGSDSLESNTTGASNTAVGSSSLGANTTGGSNTAIGRYALNDNTTGSNNTAVGWIALGANTTGNSSTAVGMYSLRSSTGGGENTALGYKAQYLNTTGLYNVAVGVNALLANTTANRGTAVGHSALSNNTTGAENTAVGFYALLNNGTGNRNVAVGDGALDANTSASDNTAMGQGALGGNTTGTRNTAVGQLAANDTTTGNDIVAMGQNALALNTTGSNNTAIGRAALEKNTTANNNTAVGYHSLLDNVTGTQNTAVGSVSLANNTATGNSAFGFYAARFNTTGVENTAIGRYSLYNNTTGSYNTAVGNLAMQNGTVTDCIAIGAEALRYNSGNRNIAIGNEACTQADGDDNIVIGDLAADASTFTGSDNVFIGNSAATRASSADTNVCIGKHSADQLTTGDDNTFVGYDSGDTVTTGFQNTCIGGRADASATIANATALGYGITVTATNNVFIGNTSVSAIKGQVAFSTYSDERIKREIEDSDLGLEFIKDLKPRKYKRVAPKDYPEEFLDKNKNDLDNPDKLVDGLIAQEVKQTMDKLGVSFSGWDEDENTTKQSLEYATFVPALIKSIQELSTQVDELKQEIKTLKGE